MKIKFKSTLDEAVEAQVRQIELSSLARKSKWQGLLLAPILFFAVFFLVPEKGAIKLLFAFLISLAFIAVYLGTYKNTLRKRLKKITLDSLGTREPIPCEYEFTPRSLIFRRGNTEISFPWYKIRQINEDNTVLEFVVENGGVAHVPLRIFSDEDQKVRCLQLARGKARTQSD